MTPGKHRLRIELLPDRAEESGGTGSRFKPFLRPASRANDTADEKTQMMGATHGACARPASLWCSGRRAGEPHIVASLGTEKTFMSFVFHLCGFRSHVLDIAWSSVGAVVDGDGCPQYNPAQLLKAASR